MSTGLTLFIVDKEDTKSKEMHVHRKPNVKEDVPGPLAGAILCCESKGLHHLCNLQAPSNHRSDLDLLKKLLELLVNQVVDLLGHFLGA